MFLVNTRIDINCDLGEIDPSLELEKSIMPYIGRANIAAGGHAGNANVIRDTMLLAQQHDVKVGIHPSFPDKQHFGRVRMDISNEDLIASIQNQIKIFLDIASANNIEVEYVKAHGALYHFLAQDEVISELYLKMVGDFNSELKFLVPPNSQIERMARKHSKAVLIEGFADRRYTRDGSLQSRSIEGSVIEDPMEVVAQVKEMVSNHGLEVDGQFVPLKVDSICVHSDTKNSLSILKAIKAHC